MVWACDDHIEDLAVFVRAQGVDPEGHVFEISRTCRAADEGETPCGAAGDYLIVRADAGAVITVCQRHMETWRPGS